MSFSPGTIADSLKKALDLALRPRFLWPGLLAIAFLASAGVSLALPFRRAVVVWFPESRAAPALRSRAELRHVPFTRDVAALAAGLMEEQLLGPLDASSRPVAVPDTRLVSSLRSGKTLYVDISDSIFFGRPSADGVYAPPALEPRVALGFIERSLRWNFPFYRIVLTVDGQEPVWREP